MWGRNVYDSVSKFLQVKLPYWAEFNLYFIFTSVYVTVFLIFRPNMQLVHFFFQMSIFIKYVFGQTSCNIETNIIFPFTNIKIYIIFPFFDIETNIIILFSIFQFQLTVNVVAILLAFLGACILNESPITSVQVCKITPQPSLFLHFYASLVVSLLAFTVYWIGWELPNRYYPTLLSRLGKLFTNLHICCVFCIPIERLADFLNILFHSRRCCGSIWLWTLLRRWHWLLVWMRWSDWLYW